MDSIKRYLQFVKPYKFKIIATIIIGLIKFSIPLMIPMLMKYIIDDVINGTNLTTSEKTHQLLLIMAGVFFIFIILRPPIEYYRQYYAQWISSVVLFDLRNKLFEHTQKLSLKYFANNKSGEIINRVINDVEQTRSFILTGLMNLWLDTATIIFAIVLMLTLNVKLTLISILFLPLYAFSVKYFYSKLRHLTRVRSKSLGEMQGFLGERISGVQVVRSFALEQHEQNQFSKTNGKFLEKSLSHTSWNAYTFSVVNTITDLSPLIVIGFAGYEVIQGNLTVGTMIAFIGYMDRLYNPLRRLVNSSTTLTQAFASMDRVFEFLDEKYDLTDNENAIDIKKIDGSIKFDNVCFKYSEEQSDVLKNISFEIKHGEKIALVGMSGGGKSSIVGLIPRFYDITSGSILIDDINVKDYKMRSLRKQIGIVLQDSVLFSDTVRDNILFGDHTATDEQVIEAAKAANAHDFITQLPQGYDTPVGERGVKLSGGQKQRIALARVFLKNPAIIILDEATSSLDLESEMLVQEALQKLAVGRTTITVAHRLSTITDVDRIFVIENGKVTEVGNHQELMAKEGSYYNLFQIQQI
ncbi:MAG: ygaD [Bacillales bacterium]|nr:ygaD [Bacillales bacterium]